MRDFLGRMKEIIAMEAHRTAMHRIALEANNIDETLRWVNEEKRYRECLKHNLFYEMLLGLCNNS